MVITLASLVPTLAGENALVAVRLESTDSVELDAAVLEPAFVDVMAPIGSELP